MKHFLKVFSIAFLCFMLVVGAGLFTFNKVLDPKHPVAEGEEPNPDNPDDPIVPEEPKSPFEKAVAESKRVNFILLGLEHERADTIIFASFDRKTKKVDLISIPRDTYYHESGHDNGDERKLNSKYGRSSEKGTMKAVEKILGVPVDHYVSVKYKGVEEIVNSLGGVEVYVPFHMDYKDPTDDPPLVIDIPAGKQTLDGEQSVKFLRYREGYENGDIGRMQAQQQFMKSAIKKVFTYKLPTVVNTCFNYIKTDLKLRGALLLVPDALGISVDEITMTTLPGYAPDSSNYQIVNGIPVSYFYHDKEKTREMMMELYEVEQEQAESND